MTAVIKPSGDYFASCRESEKIYNTIADRASSFLSVFFIAQRFINADDSSRERRPRVCFLHAAFLAPILIASTEFHLGLPSYDFFLCSRLLSRRSFLCRPIERARFYTFDRPFLLIGSNGTLSYVRKAAAGGAIYEINYLRWILYR